jgi:hypothetical protein
LADAATRAFTPESPHDRGDAARAALGSAIEQLGPAEAREMLEDVERIAFRGAPEYSPG